MAPRPTKPNPKPKPKPVLDAQGKPIAKGDAEIASRFGQFYAIMESDPALKAWFKGFADEYTAKRGQISQETFNLELNKQPWYTENSGTWITDAKEKLSDPIGYAQRLEGDVAYLRDVAVGYGVSLDDSVLTQLATSKRQFNWNDNQVFDELDKLMPVGVDRYIGAAGTAQDSLSKWVSDNGLSLTQNSIQDYVRKISRRDLTLDDVKADLRRTYMAGAYPAWSDRIMAGQDISDIAAPYKSRMAKLLEIDESQIDFNDNMLSQGLQGVGADGKAGIVPLYEFDKMIRKDPRWDRTENALKTYTDAGSSILKMFGLR